MKLYHGSTVTVKTPKIQRGRKATDFGKGFYTTSDFEQAKKWALLKQRREQSKKAVVSVYEVPDDIFHRELSVLRFEGATKEWLEFAPHRGNQSHCFTRGQSQYHAARRMLIGVVPLTQSP